MSHVAENAQDAKGMLIGVAIIVVLWIYAKVHAVRHHEDDR